MPIANHVQNQFEKPHDAAASAYQQVTGDNHGICLAKELAGECGEQAVLSAIADLVGCVNEV
ncbi:MAG: hypothetical protein DSM106950_03315 [Stigonema ocellatum SAG 48.90 = DSM 106950]|nr:hypothetical protein [Stigonema ocellatum SAG 48.90 = DSM 106950]